MNFFIHKKYYPVMLPAIGFTAFLLLARVIYSGTFMYLFFAWNIFLACVPLFLSQYLNHRKLSTVGQSFLFASWLLFFPNSLYIITDLVHLDHRYPVPLWFDIVLIFSAAANGLLAAFLSLWEVEKFLRRKFTGMQVHMILLSCLFAGSFGVYLGRYLRWNSWDVVTDPLGIIGGICKMIFYPHQYVQTWGITFVFTLFFAVVYFTVFNLRKMGKSSV